MRYAETVIDESQVRPGADVDPSPEQVRIVRDGAPAFADVRKSEQVPPIGCDTIRSKAVQDHSEDNGQHIER